MRPRAALSLAGALTLAASPSRADRPRIPPIHLVYTRGPGAASCPDARAPATRSPRDSGTIPDDTAARTLKVSIACRAGQLSVEMEMHLESGDLLWRGSDHAHLRALRRARPRGRSRRRRPRRSDPEPEPCPVCPLPEPAKPAPVEPAKSEDRAEVAVRLVPPPSVPTPPEPKTSLLVPVRGHGVGMSSVTTDRGAFGISDSTRGSGSSGSRRRWRGASIRRAGATQLSPGRHAGLHAAHWCAACRAATSSGPCRLPQDGVGGTLHGSPARLRY